MNYSDDFQEMIKKYNEELRKMKTKAKPEPNETVLTQANIQSSDEGNANNNAQSISPDILKTLTPTEKEELSEAQRFPFTNDYDLPNIKPDEMIKGQYENLGGKGKLVVRVFTANQAAPVKNASVLVSLEKADGDHLISSVKTDIDGETPILELPAVSFEESLTPEVKNPYTSYRIRVCAPDFFTIDSINVPIFDKQTAIQSVEMLPIPNGFEGDRILKSNDTGPIDLQ